MAAMKPRTGDGPIEVAKEGRNRFSVGVKTRFFFGSRGVAAIHIAHFFVNLARSRWQPKEVRQP